MIEVGKFAFLNYAVSSVLSKSPKIREMQGERVKVVSRVHNGNSYRVQRWNLEERIVHASFLSETEPDQTQDKFEIGTKVGLIYSWPHYLDGEIGKIVGFASQETYMIELSSGRRTLVPRRFVKFMEAPKTDPEKMSLRHELYAEINYLERTEKKLSAERKAFANFIEWLDSRGMSSDNGKHTRGHLLFVAFCEGRRSYKREVINQSYGAPRL